MVMIADLSLVRMDSELAEMMTMTQSTCTADSSALIDNHTIFYPKKRSTFVHSLQFLRKKRLIVLLHKYCYNWTTLLCSGFLVTKLLVYHGPSTPWLPLVPSLTSILDLMEIWFGLAVKCWSLSSLSQAKLVPAWVTVFGQANYLTQVYPGTQVYSAWAMGRRNEYPAKNLGSKQTHHMIH